MKIRPNLDSSRHCPQKAPTLCWEYTGKDSSGLRALRICSGFAASALCGPVPVSTHHHETSPCARLLISRSLLAHEQRSIFKKEIMSNTPSETARRNSHGMRQESFGKNLLPRRHANIDAPTTFATLLSQMESWGITSNDLVSTTLMWKHIHWMMMDKRTRMDAASTFFWHCFCRPNRSGIDSEI